MRIFASQGLHDRERPNTVAAFRAAAELGVDGIELDVRRTRDGVLVVHHNPIARGTAIHNAAYRELPSYIPTLEDVFDAVPELLINVEIKNYQHESEVTYDDTGTFARTLCAAIGAATRSRRVTVSCFDLATCDVVRTHSDDINVGWLLWDVDFETSISTAVSHGFHAVHPRTDAVTPRAVALAHRAGLSIAAWTATRRADVAALLEWEVDDLITDEPAAGLARRQSWVEETST